MKRMNFPRRREKRQAEALARAAQRAKRTPLEQLMKLAGADAVKESNRLRKLITKARA